MVFRKKKENETRFFAEPTNVPRPNFIKRCMVCTVHDCVFSYDLYKKNTTKDCENSDENLDVGWL